MRKIPHCWNDFQSSPLTLEVIKRKECLISIPISSSLTSYSRKNHMLLCKKGMKGVKPSQVEIRLMAKALNLFLFMSAYLWLIGFSTQEGESRKVSLPISHHKFHKMLNLPARATHTESTWVMQNDAFCIVLKVQSEK